MRFVLCLVLLAVPAAVAAVEPPYVVVLGVAQDAGFPQAGCERACCREAWRDVARREPVACLGIADPASGGAWLVDATPDLPQQLHDLTTSGPRPLVLDGVFLTHAHIGHYTGLVHFGREAMGARKVPVFALPRLHDFLSRSGPWEQLVRLQNVDLRALVPGVPVRLGSELHVTPFLVPHRDEYSETAGFRIRGPSRTVVYIPDIDKWDRWEERLESVVASADVVLVDGTFHDAGEVPGRDMAEIPHPFVVETVRRLQALPQSERSKVIFVHLNHTNPLLQPGSPARQAVETAGFRVARRGERIPL